MTKPKMWAVFYKNSGSFRIRAIGIEAKLSLLLRSVFCTVNRKFSRWPFAKSVAIELDAMQVNMVSYLMRLPRLDSEDWVTWIRRRRRVARNLCSRIGMWSEDWANRCISWHEHVLRCNNISSHLVQYKNSEWLRHLRGQWVGGRLFSNSRNSVLAGRTGTRLNVGKPQQRWETGIELARKFIASRRNQARNSNSLSVGSRIRDAALRLAEFSQMIRRRV